MSTPVGKSKGVKKTAKKTTKKVVKKVVRKKVVKKVVRKKVAKKTTAKAVPTKAAKSKTMPTHPQAPGRVLGQSFTLSTLGILSLPHNLDAVAIATARYGGVMFALVGAFFTLFYAQAVFSIIPSTQIANVIGGDGDVPGECTTASCGDQPNVPGTVPDQSNESEPAAWGPVIELDISETSPLSDRVSIFVAVEEADRVKVYALNTENGQMLFLGSAERRSNASWELLWDTREYPNGSYIFKVIAYGPYGAVDSVIDEEFVVANETDPVTSEVTYDENGAGAVSETDAPENTEENVETETDSVDTDTTDVEEADEARREGEVDETDAAAETEVPETESETTEPMTEEVEEVSTEEETREEEMVTDEVAEIADPEIQTNSNTNFVLVNIDAPEATHVEVYARKTNENRSQYLGRAARQGADRWKYYWDTRNVANGEYSLYVQTFYPDESRESDVVVIEVVNEIVSTNTEVAAEIAKTVTQAVKKAELDQVVPTAALPPEPATSEDNNTDTGVVSEPVVTPKPIPAIDLTESEILSDLEIPAALVVPAVVKERIESETADVITDYEERLVEEGDRLAAAIRSGDADAIERVKERFATIESELNETVTELTGEDEAVVDNLVARKVAERIVQTEKAERIISERIGETAEKDTDGDGITDFDEVEIFKTDPTNPDSDNDGFNDNAEILGGYNPNDAAPEAVVEFESPKRAGVTRPDILKIEKIVPLTADEYDTTPDQPEAIISGTALPNSFVTLYVFSNPVVVTVRTDAQGNWSYQFDKEIEDGEHEVYIGVTDNAGRVMAKSEPVRFVKTAEAFTPVDASDEVAVIQSTSDNDSLFDQQLLLLVASISVVSVGIILILLGLWLEHRRRLQPGFALSNQPEAVA